MNQFFFGNEKTDSLKNTENLENKQIEQKSENDISLKHDTKVSKNDDEKIITKEELEKSKNKD